MTATQENRSFRVKTALGDDALLLQSFAGTDTVSVPFEYSLRVLSPDANIDMDGQLGKAVVISLELPDGSDRHIHGLINHMKLAASGDGAMVGYEISVVPWLWFLKLFTNCRIFQNLSVLDIVEKVFKDRGFSEFRNATTGSYQPREYCVQYRETDFNFVSRLLEEEGIFYYFEHTEQKHQLVLADNRAAFAPCPGQARARYSPSQGDTAAEDDVILVLEQQFTLFPGTATVNAYDFEKPATSLLASISGAQKGEIYEYRNRHRTKDDGNRYAGIRLEEQEAGIEVITGSGNFRAFQAGYRFTLQDHPRASSNKDYTLLRVVHTGKNAAYSGGNASGSLEYRNSFEAIPNSVPFKPARRARRPVVEGSQTAVVVGKSGEDIWTDKYGRVKVQFFWDREGKFDENSSCWVRVSQFWAGKQFGTIFTPRIGQEVIVDFLEGDPDQPIITGRVYNADQTVPYPLPGEQTKSTIKSMSSKGGGGFNEIRLEDLKGSEQIFIHGEKDLDIRVKNDRKENILRDRHLDVTRDKMEKIGRDDHVYVARDQIVKLDRDHHLTVSGKQAIQIAGSHSMEVQGNVAEEFKGSFSSQVTQSFYIKAMDVVIEGATQLSLKVGGNFINISPAGVTIQGTMVLINSGGAAGTGAAGTLVSPVAPTGPAAAVNADPGAATQAASGSPAAQQQLTELNIAPAQKRSAASDSPTHRPDAPENQDKKSWIEIELLDEDGKPVAGEPYRITLPDGSTVADGTLDDQGRARVAGLDPGTCKVTFPNLDRDAWKKA